MNTSLFLEKVQASSPWGTAVALLILAVLVGFAVRSLIKKKGDCGCGCGSSCSSCSSCHPAESETESGGCCHCTEHKE